MRKREEEAMGVVATVMYLAATVAAYRFGMRNIDRFAWHSSKVHYCYGVPCKDCRMMMGMIALSWPVSAWPMMAVALRAHGPEKARRVAADRVAKDMLARGVHEDEAWRAGVMAYEGKPVHFSPLYPL